MQTVASTGVQGKKNVRVIPATITPEAKELQSVFRPLRVAAYCRVSTKEEEQLNSYELQQRYYSERIQQEPKWTLAGIYADKGISGTSVKRRDEFNRMIRDCKRGKIDMIITKSISRFSRNTVDCLSYVRLLKEIGVDVYFEEQNIHSTQNGAEFYITLYGSIAQSEAENISANVRFGKAQSAKEGKVPFYYKTFIGYRKGEDGNPEIVPEEAEIIRKIYRRYLAGDSLNTIAEMLTADRIPTPTGNSKWSPCTVKRILTNEKYKGDALLNKTYVTDCITKKVRINNGERPKYYVENNHPAIIDSATFSRVQAEMARRAGRTRTNYTANNRQYQVQVKYSSKYALTDILICGKCHTPYRRRVWNCRGKTKVVWRCLNRLENGKKHCPDSVSIEESVLHKAIMEAIAETAKESDELIERLKLHIAMVLNPDESEDPVAAIEIRIAEIDREYERQLMELARNISNDTFDDTKIKELMEEKQRLQQQIEQLEDMKQRRKNAASQISEIYDTIDSLKNDPLEYDDQAVRKMLECVVVESAYKIKVVFVGGTEVIKWLV